MCLRHCCGESHTTTRRHATPDTLPHSSSVTTALQHTQHCNARPQQCDTGHRHNVGVSPYIALLQNSGKLRNEMYLRSSRCVFVFRSFVLFVYVITKHPANTSCDLQRCVSYFLRIFAVPRDRQPLPSCPQRRRTIAATCLCHLCRDPRHHAVS